MDELKETNITLFTYIAKVMKVDVRNDKLYATLHINLGFDTWKLNKEFKILGMKIPVTEYLSDIKNTILDKIVVMISLKKEDEYQALIYVDDNGKLKELSDVIALHISK